MKSKQIANYLFTWILLLLSELLSAQSSTDLELQNRYWNYRERLRKHFSSIGQNPGQGFAFSEITTHDAANTKVDDGPKGLFFKKFSNRLDFKKQLHMFENF